MSKKIGQGIRQAFRKAGLKVNVTIDGTHVVNVKLVSGDGTDAENQIKYDELMAGKLVDLNSPEQIEARATGAPIKTEKVVKEKKEKVVKEKKEKKAKKGEVTKVSREQLQAELDNMEEADLQLLTSRALAGKAQNFPIGFVGKTYKDAAGKKTREEHFEIILGAFAEEEPAV